MPLQNTLPGARRGARRDLVDRSFGRRAVERPQRREHQPDARRRPPRGCARVTLPPCSSMIFFTIARPRPVPLAARGHIGLGQPVHRLRQAAAVVLAPRSRPARRVSLSRPCTQPAARAVRAATCARAPTRPRSAAGWSAPAPPGGHHNTAERHAPEAVFRTGSPAARPAAGRPPGGSGRPPDSRSNTGAGIRAKAENSLISRPMLSTWRTIVSALAANASGSFWICGRYLRLSRSAESRIGVSGFLISCAMRRAISAQAALRCAASSSVMSSKVTTKPLMPAAVGLRRGAHQQRMGAVLAMQLELRLGRPLGRGRDAGEQARDLGDHRDQRAADQLVRRAADQVAPPSGSAA